MGWDIVARPFKDCDSCWAEQENPESAVQHSAAGRNRQLYKRPPLPILAGSQGSACHTLSWFSWPQTDAITEPKLAWAWPSCHMGHRNLGHVAKLPCFVSSAFPDYSTGSVVAHDG